MKMCYLISGITLRNFKRIINGIYDELAQWILPSS